MIYQEPLLTGHRVVGLGVKGAPTKGQVIIVYHFLQEQPQFKTPKHSMTSSNIRNTTKYSLCRGNKKKLCKTKGKNCC